MARNLSDSSELCYGCGKTTKKGDRRVINTLPEILNMWTSLARGLLEDRKEPEIMNSIEHLFESTNRIFMCRNCHYAYQSHLDEQKRLSCSLTNVLGIITGIQGFSSQLQKRTSGGSSDAPAAKKKSKFRNVIAQLSVGPPASPKVHVTVDNGSGDFRDYLIKTPSRKDLVKATARKSERSVALNAMENPKRKEYTINHIEYLVRQEMITMCSSKTKSVLFDPTVADLQTFSWKKIIDELVVKAPIFVGILRACLKTRRNRQNTDAIIVICASILLKHRYNKINLVQKVLSLILYAGHTGKQVYNRLQKLNLCMSHGVTIRVVNKAGVEHDKSVLNWRDSLASQLCSSNVQDHTVEEVTPIHPSVDGNADSTSVQDHPIEEVTLTHPSVDSNADSTSVQDHPIEQVIPMHPSVDDNADSISASHQCSTSFQDHAMEEIDFMHLSVDDENLTFNSLVSHQGHPIEGFTHPDFIHPFVDDDDSTSHSSTSASVTDYDSSSDISLSIAAPSASPITEDDQSSCGFVENQSVPAENNVSQPSILATSPPTIETISGNLQPVMNINTEVNPICPASDPVDNQTESMVTTGNDCGYKLVMDNIDLNIKARYTRRNNHSNKSLHFVHAYALKSRVNLSHLPNGTLQSCLNSSKNIALQLLPSPSDDKLLRQNLKTLLSRILVNNMPYFNQTFDGVISWHIKHKYYKEMSSKSKYVPLGVILKNENVHDEMVEIMSQLYQYVPSIEYTTEVHTAGIDDVKREALIHPLLLGGDQLTAARARGVIKSRMNSKSPAACFKGLTPCIEDWHVQMLLLEIIWKHFYSRDSSREFGTMYQLRNLIGHCNVTTSPEKNFNACDDFFKLLVSSYVLAASMEIFEMESLKSLPVLEGITDVDTIWAMTDKEREDILNSICDTFLDKFLCFEFNKKPSATNDKVYDYSRKLLSIGLFYLEYSDAIKEGDGERVLRCWKYLLPLFRNTQRKNYSIEALRLLYQYHHAFTPRQQEELIWNRFVNVNGHVGKNIPADLHQEHLNRLCKTAVQNLGPNKTNNGIVRVGKALGALSPILNRYDEITSIGSSSGTHHKPAADKDRNLLIQCLIDHRVFKAINSNRMHTSFKKPKDLMHSHNDKKLMQWMIGHINAYR